MSIDNDWNKQEKEKEMQLAMEERDLQKMATLSKQDTLRDELQSQIEEIRRVQV